MNETVAENLLKLASQNLNRTTIPAVLGIIFMGYYLSSSIAQLSSLYWVLAASLSYLLRPIILKKIQNIQFFPISKRLILTGVYNSVVGASVSACIFFFPQLDVTQQLLITLFLAGFVAVSGMAHIGNPTLFLFFAIPMLLPLGIIWMMDPGGYLGHIIAPFVGAFIILMIPLLTILGRDTFRTYAAYIELSENQSRLSAELSAALERAEHEQRRAEASNRSKTRFLAAASHDLRQPVHVVSLFGSALETMVESKEVKEIVNDMNISIQSLAKQLNGLLDIAKLDSDTEAPNFSWLNLNSLINQMKDEFQTEANDKNIKIVGDIDKSYYVWTDDSMLSQILRNITGNAIKYTNQGSVTFTAERDDQFVTLSCTDTGIGMTEEDRQQIFEEFFQIDNPERNKNKGIGLGLSIVERLAKSLSHELSVASHPGMGTCVSLRLQLSTVAPEKDQINYTEPAVSQQNTTAKNWVHIVDDEPTVCKSMGVLLEELGCRVTSSSSTKETVEFMQTNRPDAVLVDLRLKGSDSGIKTLNAIEKIDSSIFRAMVTGETFFNLEDTGLSNKVKLLHKPVSKERVVGLLEQLHDHELEQS